VQIPHLLRAPLVLAVCAAPAAADILMLKDGRVVDDKPMHRVADGIEIRYEHGVVLVPTALVQDAVLEEDKVWTPQTEEEKTQTAKGFVRFEGKWVTPRQREELVAKRVEKHKKLLEEMKSHREWRNRQILDTKFFRFEYTLPQHVFEPYRDAMEAYFAEFARTWKIKTPKAEERLPVCFYVDEESFHQIGGVPPGVLGYFRFVKPWDLNIFYERLDPGLSEDVMFHEANHYLQLLVDQKFAVPHFPGESLAEYYGASSWDPEKKKLTVGLIQEGRLCEIQTDSAGDERPGLAQLISAPRGSPGAYQHYTWGWSFVHFLMNDARYRDKFVRFFLSLSGAKGVAHVSAGNGDMQTIEQADVLTVFMRELGLKDANALRKLEAEWYDYVDTKLKLVGASGLEKAGFEAKHAGRKLRATRLLQEALDKGSTNALVYKELAELLVDAGKPEVSIELLKKGLAIDPLNGEFYHLLAERMRAFGKDHKDEFERLQALAKEVGFDDPWADVEIDFDGDGKPDAPKPGEKEPPTPDGPGGQPPPKPQ
jgi:hypothetical protein